MEKILAIYDSDLVYATRFMEFFEKRKDFDFEISVFTRKDSLEDFLKEHKIEILLLGEGFLPEEIPKENIKYIYGLSAHPRKEKDIGYPNVFKYQRAGEVMSEIISDYTRKENETKVSSGSKDMCVISIFSPIPDITKLTFAWSLALILSEKKKTLFIPLDFLPVPIISSSDNSNQAISELIYYLKDNNPNIITKMNSLLRYIGGLSYLSGLTLGLDLLSIGREDTGRWIEELKAHTDYEAVVFYLGLYTDSILEIINQSNSVFVTVQDKLYEKTVLKEWERQMDFIGIPTNQANFQKINVPEEEWAGKMVSVQELKNSEAWSCALQYAKNL